MTSLTTAFCRAGGLLPGFEAGHGELIILKLKGHPIDSGQQASPYYLFAFEM
jgi:hypothetical protein